MTDKPVTADAPVPTQPAPAPPAQTGTNVPKASSTKKNVAIGAAAVGIGSAAIVAALLYTRRR